MKQWGRNVALGEAGICGEVGNNFPNIHAGQGRGRLGSKSVEMASSVNR